MLSVAVRPSSSYYMPARPYVLLVDDHRPTLRRLQEVVELEGHATVAAASAAEAIRACDLRPPQVLVTDLAMPNLDGRGLARWMKARHPSVPLILVTGELLDESALVPLRRLFSAVYTKPVHLPSLLDRLARMMPVPPNRARDASRP